eukprot:gene25617-11334_t
MSPYLPQRYSMTAVSDGARPAADDSSSAPPLEGEALLFQLQFEVQQMRKAGKNARQRWWDAERKLLVSHERESRMEEAIYDLADELGANPETMVPPKPYKYREGADEAIDKYTAK